eukprot:TRINITY_DN7437_c0_g1_i1.p1 TRINITY_DN7437_c0_g1~~TRINITY_DN7437_c0_g1_i1.p1  ORF type:complete len:692 (+),score=96.12 TRINITY_DN7437_c0_g1_i1:168-2243(+)
MSLHSPRLSLGSGWTQTLRGPGTLRSTGHERTAMRAHASPRGESRGLLMPLLSARASRRTGQQAQDTRRPSKLPPLSSRQAAPHASLLSQEQQRSTRNSDASLGHLHRGASVHHVSNGLIDLLISNGFDRSLTVREFVPRLVVPVSEGILCPRDQEMGAAYVDTIYGEDYAGISSHMLSYSWNYPTGDIVGALCKHSREVDLDQKMMYVWMCCLCINQHRVDTLRAAGKTVPFTDFEEAFGSRVQAIGKILVLMTPWESPVYLTRAWCVFEMYTAVSLRGRFHTGILSPDGGKHFDAVWQVLRNARVQDATASVSEDKAQIMALIEKGPGCDAVNYAIAEFLKMWFIESAERLALQRLRDKKADILPKPSFLLTKDACRECNVGQLIEKVGELLMERGLLDRALNIWNEALQASSSGRVQLPDLTRAQLLSNVGYVHYLKADRTSAMSAYTKAKEMLTSKGAFETPEGASLLRRIGMARFLQGGERGRTDALESYTEAKQIRLRTGTLATLEGAGLLLSLGNSEKSSTHARKAFDEAIEMLHRVENHKNSPQGAKLLLDLSKCMYSSGDVDAALQLCSEAESVRRRTATMATPGGADLLAFLGTMKLEAATSEAETSEALELLQMAKRIRVDTGTSQTMSGVNLMNKIGTAKSKLGDDAGWQDAIKEAERIRDRLKQRAREQAKAKVGDGL